VVGDESFEKVDEFVVNDLGAGWAGVGFFIFGFVFLFEGIGEEGLFLESSLDVFEFGEIVEFKGFPGFDGFEEEFALLEGLFHVLDGEGLEEFVDLEGKTLTSIGHERGIRIVRAVHGVASLIFGHEVVEHVGLRGDYGKKDFKMSEI
jgi:hypothetical protein